MFFCCIYLLHLEGRTLITDIKLVPLRASGVTDHVFVNLGIILLKSHEPNIWVTSQLLLTSPSKIH